MSVAGPAENTRPGAKPGRVGDSAPVEDDVPVGDEVPVGDAVPVAAALAGARQLLSEAGVPSPEVDARLLALHVTARDVLPREFTHPQWVAFAQAIERRRLREPLQHITGRMYFRYLDLVSRPGAFIVRPETECVAQAAIDFALRVPAPVHLLDLCTGSGAIAASLATEVAGARVWAVELSERAGDIARDNFARTGANVNLVMGDACEPQPQLEGIEFDVVVSNPPYVPPTEVPDDPEVALHDPEIALYGGGDDGTLIPAAIARQAMDYLRPGGLLVIEHANTQGELMRAHLGALGYLEIETKRDLAGKPRYTTGLKPGPELVRKR